MRAILDICFYVIYASSNPPPASQKHDKYLIHLTLYDIIRLYLVLQRYALFRSWCQANMCLKGCLQKTDKRKRVNLYQGRWKLLKIGWGKHYLSTKVHSCAGDKKGFDQLYVIPKNRCPSCLLSSNGPAALKINNCEIVVNFYHISHNLIWYSAIVQKSSRIYSSLFNLWTNKTIHVNLCKELRNQSQKE